MYIQDYLHQLYQFIFDCEMLFASLRIAIFKVSFLPSKVLPNLAQLCNQFSAIRKPVTLLVVMTKCYRRLISPKCFSNRASSFAVVKSQAEQLFFFFNWDSLHARLNSHYEAWSYKKKSTKKITGYRKSVQKEPTVKRRLLILDLKPPRS